MKERKAEGGLSSRQLPYSARAAFENPFNKKKWAKVNVFPGSPNFGAFLLIIVRGDIA